MTTKKVLMFFLPLLFASIGLITACGGGAPTADSGLDEGLSVQESTDEPGKTGLRTPTPAPGQAAASGDTDPIRWTQVTSFQGAFTFTLERDIKEDTLGGGSQMVRSSRSATGTITLQRIDEDNFSGEGTMTWSVDDLIEVRGDNDEVVRTATAQGEGETTLNPGETLLWLDLEFGTYGLAISPEGLYDMMEVHGTENFIGMEPTVELGPLGYLGLMDTAGIAGWFDDLSLPAAGLVLGGNLELPDGSMMTWVLQPGS